MPITKPKQGKKYYRPAKERATDRLGVDDFMLAEEEERAAKEADKRMSDSIEQVTASWKRVIESGWKYKERVFGKDAKEAFDFFGSDHQFLFDPSDDRCMLRSLSTKEVDQLGPGFVMTYNIVAELVQIFGPAIYHRNPNRMAQPVLPLELRRDYYVSPILELQAQKLEQQLNSMITEYASPIASQLVGQGMDEEEAQQQAQQQVMQDENIAHALQPIGQQLQQLQQQIQQANDKWEFDSAYQAQKLSHSYTISDVLERLLNYTPEANDLRSECRLVVDETLIKGHGVWITELEPTPDGNKYVVASNYVPVDDYLIDPDVKRVKHASWVAIRYVEPTWMVEDRWGYKRGTIKGNLCSELYSSDQTASKEGAWCPRGSSSANVKQAREGIQTNDMLVYYKLFSKMGAGTRLKDMADKEAGKVMEQFGEHCCLLITNTLKHPINMHPDDLKEMDLEELKANLAWPTEFYRIGEWPTTDLMFHWQDCSYGMSHIKPGIGELKFLDYTMSHLANKVRTASQDLVGVIKAASDDLSKQFNTVTKNGYTILEIEAMWGKSVADVISFLPKPPFNGDIWNVVAQVAQRLDKRLGLTELAYGLSTTQSRSALDARNKDDHFSVRPDDMAATVEEAAKKLAKKEAFCMASHYERDDVEYQLGEAGAEIYMEIIASKPPEEIIQQFDFTIEAGSIRKPSKERDVETHARNDQTLLPFIGQYCGTTMDWEPANWYFKTLASKAYNWDSTGLNFKNPNSQEPSPEQKRMAKIQKQIAELNIQAMMMQAQNNISKIKVEEAKIAAANNESDAAQAERWMDLRHKEELHVQKLAEMLEKAKQEMKIDEAEHRQEMQQDRESFEITKQANAASGGNPSRMAYYKSGERPYR